MSTVFMLAAIASFLLVIPLAAQADSHRRETRENGTLFLGIALAAMVGFFIAALTT